MTDHHEATLEAAGAWYARLRAQDSAGTDHSAFADWLAADAHHRLAYADVCAAALALEQVQISVPAEAAAPVRPLPTARRRSTNRMGWLAGMAAAFALAFGLSQGASPWQNVISDAYTAAAEQRWVDLEDGTRVFLDGDSALSIDYTAEARHVKLLRGAALFEVKSDRSRPFTVEADGVLAQALGTQYTVEHTPLGVRVDVREGVVGVSRSGGHGEPTRVEAGHEVVVENGLVPEIAAALDADAFAWTEARLVFSGASLRDAVAKLDRHVPGRVVLWRDAKGSAPVTAAIPIDGARAGLEAIVREQGLVLSSVPGVGLVIHE